MDCDARHNKLPMIANFGCFPAVVVVKNFSFSVN